MQVDAALPGAGFEAGLEVVPVQAIDETAHELEVQATDQVGEVLGEGVEGTVGEGYATRLGARLITTGAQHAGGGAQHGGPARPWPGLVPDELTKGPSRPSGHVAQGVAYRRVVALCGGDGPGQEPSGEFVVAWGQADGQLT